MQKISENPRRLDNRYSVPKVAFGGKKQKGDNMKILSFVGILALALVFLCGSALAQSFPTDKDSKIVSGSFAFSSMGGDLYESGEDGDRMTSIQFYPSVSYFVTPGFALGGKLILERLSQGDDGFTTWGIGPQLLYFIGGNQPKVTVKGATYPYFGAAFLYTSSTVKMELLGETEESTTSGTIISFGGGICNMLSNTVGLTVEASYEIDNMKPEEGDSQSGNKFNILAGIVAFLW
jgi:hypothetical protein